MPRTVKRGRAKTPTVLQMEAVECGAASLSIILGYFKRFVPLEELRQKCGVSRDGSKANNLLKAARGYGLEASGFKLNFDQLRERSFPCIVWWNQNHFLVVEGIVGNKVVLNDPAAGPRKVTLEEFEDSYTKVALYFEPGPDFEPGGRPVSLISSMLPRMTPYKPAVAFFILSAVFLVIPGMAVPAFTRVFIDEILVASRDNWLNPLLLGMGLVAVITMALTWLQQRSLLRYQTVLALAESARFFSHILRLPTTFFSQRFGGEIGQRVMINDRIANMVAEKMPQFVVNLMKTGFFGLLMFFYDLRLAAATFLLAGINFLVIRLVARVRLDCNRRLLQDEGKLIGTAMGGLQMIETIKGTGGEEEFFARWAGYQAKTLRSKQKLGLLGHTTAAVPVFIEACTSALILGFGGYIVMTSDAFTIGMLVAFQTVAQNFTKPFNDIVNFAGQIQELQGDMARVDDVLDHPRDPVYQKTDIVDPGAAKLSGLVELREITFGYNPLGRPLIDKFSLTIRPGQRIALVGGSGSGKSTVAKLVSGLYQPWSGEILFDGIPRDRLPHDVLNGTMAVVDQEIFLFEGTVRENLAMWDATIPDTVLTDALRDAFILHKIAERPGGLSSHVEENGQNFSGGERQRLEIARALVPAPRFLILDEATSALDPPTEKEIERNLMRRGCCCMIVAHRLSTIRDCDEIIVMDDGKVVERGTHAELLAKQNHYARLIKE
jgi:NHLM bacteriocin system ABC transporter peptidase/ATP-binding protein